MRHWALLANFAVAATACSVIQTAEPTNQSIATQSATETIPISATSTTPPTTTATPTLAPTSTRTPRPTSTPLPDVGFSSAVAETSYEVPLSVQSLTPFEATMYFELDTPAKGWLLYQPVLESTEGWWAVPLADQEVSHLVPLVGLRPGTRYTTQVGIGSDLSNLHVPRLFDSDWGPIHFETPPLGMTDLRIGVIGDSGFGDDETGELINLMTKYDLDFVLHTGDTVYRANEESSPAEAFARKYYRPFEPLLREVPVFPVLGNHDYDRPLRFDARPFFVRAFAGMTNPSIPENALGTWYAFEWADIQFLMLDSHTFHGSGGRAEQTAWLEERLQDPSYRFSIPVFHTPPYTSGRHTSDGRALRIDWKPLFESAGVPVVFSGHDHNYERVLLNGVTYVVSGGGSPVLYPASDRVEGSEKFHRRMHFVLVEVFSEHITLSAIDGTGTVLDRTSIFPPQE